MKVYLSGPISSMTFTGASDWRTWAATVLGPAGFTVLDPMRGKSFLSNQKTIEREVYEQTKRVDLSDKALVNRDHSDVVAADIVLVNLLPAERVSIGTMFELAWAKAYQKIVVIVMEPGNIHDHPFVREAGVIFDDLERAVDYIVSCNPEPPKEIKIQGYSFMKPGTYDCNTERGC